MRCISLSPQPVSSPPHLNSSHVFSTFFTSSHLIPSHVFCPWLSSSQLVTTALLMLPELFSSLLISAPLSLFQTCTAPLNSSQPSAAHVSSSDVFFSLLSSHFPSSSHISSADLSFSQLVSPDLSSSQCTLKSSQPSPAKTCSKQGSWYQSKLPLCFPQGRFNT